MIVSRPEEFCLDAFADPELESLKLAVAIYGLRRKRDAASARRGLFGEPGWDILLDLYIADRRRTEVQVSSVCLDAGVPSTTILRWIARLEQEGLIYRIADSADARRRYVRLTEDGHEMMRNVLRALSGTALG
jgi:MarR family transcriptional regulator, temperature-dependent positive regulator of motility